MFLWLPISSNKDLLHNIDEEFISIHNFHPLLFSGYLRYLLHEIMTESLLYKKTVFKIGAKNSYYLHSYYIKIVIHSQSKIHRSHPGILEMV